MRDQHTGSQQHGRSAGLAESPCAGPSAVGVGCGRWRAPGRRCGAPRCRAAQVTGRSLACGSACCWPAHPEANDRSRVSAAWPCRPPDAGLTKTSSGVHSCADGAEWSKTKACGLGLGGGGAGVREPGVRRPAETSLAASEDMRCTTVALLRRPGLSPSAAAPSMTTPHPAPAAPSLTGRWATLAEEPRVLRRLGAVPELAASADVTGSRKVIASVGKMRRRRCSLALAGVSTVHAGSGRLAEGQITRTTQTTTRVARTSRTE
eukprot:scaffold8634_cov115-Isochrysis_galbana.AAC.8